MAQQTGTVRYLTPLKSQSLIRKFMNIKALSNTHGMSSRNSFFSCHFSAISKSSGVVILIFSFPSSTLAFFLSSQLQRLHPKIETFFLERHLGAIRLNIWGLCKPIIFPIFSFLNINMESFLLLNQS